jgi:hypothetical protein
VRVELRDVGSRASLETRTHSKRECGLAPDYTYETRNNFDHAT